MSKDLEERIAKLEMIISYQEQIFDDLNDVVLGQQKQIDTLQLELRKFQQTFRRQTGQKCSGCESLSERLFEPFIPHCNAVQCWGTPWWILIRSSLLNAA